MRRTIAALALGAAVAAGPIAFAGKASAASPIEDQRATQNLTSTLNASMAVGGLAGTATGAVAGCIVGAVATTPALGIGCVPGAVAGAGIGGVLGTLAVGGGALVVAGSDAVATYHAAPGTTRWAQ